MPRAGRRGRRPWTWGEPCDRTRFHATKQMGSSGSMGCETRQDINNKEFRNNKLWWNRAERWDTTESNHLLEGQWLDGHLLLWKEGLRDKENDEEDVEEGDEGGQDHNGLVAPWTIKTWGRDDDGEHDMVGRVSIDSSLPRGDNAWCTKCLADSSSSRPMSNVFVTRSSSSKSCPNTCCWNPSIWCSAICCCKRGLSQRQPLWIRGKWLQTIGQLIDTSLFTGHFFYWTGHANADVVPTQCTQTGLATSTHWSEASWLSPTTKFHPHFGDLLSSNIIYDVNPRMVWSARLTNGHWTSRF